MRFWGKPHKIETILVVKHDRVLMLEAIDLIESEGLEAVGAINADHAINMLEARTDIRLVFTDVELLGNMDGLVLSHYVRARWPHVHLIVASGQVVPHGYEFPANTKFFSKPYHEHAIIQEMNRLLPPARPN